ncbi:hypothetical protein HPP92_001085 [Vanilla planifolia]|uniref:Transmembrane protein n=1 Tax=Vanilla planifolia TaxID=51239 RepID=A0A835S1V1_VANPL|nr:hypothetical protein HPP92_001085 [Vanilla planifolia]
MPWLSQMKGESEMGQRKQTHEGILLFFNLVKQSFHALSLTLLSLLLPLSFLLLARLASPPPSSTPTSIILYILITFLTLNTLLSAITGRRFGIRPLLAIAWAFLCLFQACITLGIEATIQDGFKPLEDGSQTIHEKWMKRSFLVIGIYDITMLWRRMFVKPVVDDTVFGDAMEEKMIEKFVITAAFGGLWLWLLRQELEPLVLAAGRGGLRKAVTWSGFHLWLVSFATVLIGTVRVAQVLFWFACILLKFSHFRVEKQHDFPLTENIDL